MGMPARWPLLLSLAAVLLLDQLLKILVLRAPHVVALGPGIRIRVAPPGRMFAGRLGVPPSALGAIWLATLIAVTSIAPSALPFGSGVSLAAVGAALGGAAGNLFDLFARPGVVDYLEVGPWPAFNLADAAIVMGVIVAIAAR